MTDQEALDHPVNLHSLKMLAALRQEDRQDSRSPWVNLAEASREQEGQDLPRCRAAQVEDSLGEVLLAVGGHAPAKALRFLLEDEDRELLDAQEVLEEQEPLVAGQRLLDLLQMQAGWKLAPGVWDPQGSLAGANSQD